MKKQKMSDRDLKHSISKAFKKRDLKIYALDDGDAPIEEEDDKSGKCCICNKRIK